MHFILEENELLLVGTVDALEGQNLAVPGVLNLEHLGAATATHDTNFTVCDVVDHHYFLPVRKDSYAIRSLGMLILLHWWKI